MQRIAHPVRVKEFLNNTTAAKSADQYFLFVCLFLAIQLVRAAGGTEPQRKPVSRECL